MADDLIEKTLKDALKTATEQSTSNTDLGQTVKFAQAVTQAQTAYEEYQKNKPGTISFDVSKLKCCGGSVLDMFGKINIKMNTAEITVNPTVEASLTTHVVVNEQYNHIHTINHLPFNCTVGEPCDPKTGDVTQQE